MVISGVISRITIIVTHIRGLKTLLLTTHEPPSSIPTERLYRDLSGLYVV